MVLDYWDYKFIPSIVFTLSGYIVMPFWAIKECLNAIDKHYPTLNNILVFMPSILILIAGANIQQINKEKEIETEKQNYSKCLEELSKDPNNTELRRTALEAGRLYYSSLREDKIITVYDEAALNNDLLAAGGTGSNK